MNTYNADRILQLISLYSISFPISAGISNFRKINPLQKKLFFYLVFSAIMDSIVSWYSFKHWNNMPLFHIGTMFEFLFFSFLFYEIISSVRFKKLILIIVISYLIYNAIWLYFFGDIFQFNHQTRAIHCLLLVFFALSYFNFLSLEISIKPFSFINMPMFWVCIGVLLYYTGNFFLFSFYYYIAKPFPVIWTMHSVLNVLTNLLFMISFLCRAR